MTDQQLVAIYAIAGLAWLCADYTVRMVRDHRRRMREMDRRRAMYSQYMALWHTFGIWPE